MIRKILEAFNRYKYEEPRSGDMYIVHESDVKFKSVSFPEIPNMPTHRWVIVVVRLQGGSWFHEVIDSSNSLSEIREILEQIMNTKQ